MGTLRGRVVALGVVAASLHAFVVASGAGEHRRPVRTLLEIRERNVVRQRFDLSCGAAALATLLTYQHQDAVAETEVARGLIRRPDYLTDPGVLRARGGFSLLDFQRYAEGRGYEGIGFGRLTLRDLLPLAPAIVPVHANGYDHFVVFRGLRGDRVVVADPAWGNRTLRIERFETAWAELPPLGRVAFVLKKRGQDEPPAALAPGPEDFFVSPRADPAGVAD